MLASRMGGLAGRSTSAVEPQCVRLAIAHRALLSDSRIIISCLSDSSIPTHKDGCMFKKIKTWTTADKFENNWPNFKMHCQLLLNISLPEKFKLFKKIY